MPKRILYIHGISEIGGSERDLLCLLKRLDRAKWDPFVVCPPDSPLLKEVERFRIAVYPMNLPSWRKLKGAIRVPLAVWSLFNLIRAIKIDLVHVNDYWWGPIAYLASSMARIPCVVHIRQEIEPCRVRQYWFKKPRRLIAMSERIKSVATGSGVNPSRITVIYSGIDTSHTVDPSEGKRIRDHYHLSPHQPVIGTVANLFPRKGYEYLIQALVEINRKNPGVHCLIVGEGDEVYRARLLEMIQEKGLEEMVTFAGFQSDVLPYIAAMDIFVLPSVMEGFGIVLLEAMAMGRPVVATAVGGIPEVVQDGITGFLVPPRDSESLAKRLLYLFNHPEEREKFGQTGRQRVVEVFSASRMATDLQNLYEEVIS